MRYSDAVASAPPGASRFVPEDLLRLDRWALALLLSDGPGAIPPEEAAAALGRSGRHRLADRLPAAARDRLLAARPAADADAARARVVRGSFWVLVYLLEPALWDALSVAEELPGALLGALPPARTVLEVAAGTGRLTGHLAGRTGRLVAIEPCAQLRVVLSRRVPEALVVGGLGQAAPIRDGWAELVVSCASFGPDAPLGGERVVAELERCAAPGGWVALVGPEQPEWFQARGYSPLHFDAAPAPMPADLVEFFGPQLQPPADLLVKRT